MIYIKDNDVHQQVIVVEKSDYDNLNDLILELISIFGEPSKEWRIEATPWTSNHTHRLGDALLVTLTTRNPEISLYFKMLYD